ncbi:MAG TPA: glycosyltransferase, partial [Bacteroidia bacterium]
KQFEKKQFNHNLNLYYIGIILENRGILQIAEAVHLLKTEGYDPHFHCVGELYSDLDRKIRSLPYYKEISGNLHFYGRMNLEEGYKMAEKMDIGMCIIWRMKNSEESYPTKLFEYMRVGLPIVTSNFKLYEEVVEGNGAGICVNPMVAEEIKKAVLTIHTDVKKSELMSKNGKMAVLEKYDWASQKSLLMGVYRGLVH